MKGSKKGEKRIDGSWWTDCFDDIKVCTMWIEKEEEEDINKFIVFFF